MQRFRAARRSLAAMAVGAVLVVGTAGCGADESAAAGGAAGEQGYVAGDGTVVVLAPDERQPAPEVSGPTLDGGTFTLSDHLGEVVVMNVWASWCAPCRKEAPALESVWQEYEGDGVQFVGLDTRDSDAAAVAFVRNYGLTYPQLLDPDGRQQLLFRQTLPPQSIPSTVLVDAEGRVAARALGAVSEAQLRGLIDAVLGEDVAG